MNPREALEATIWSAMIGEGRRNVGDAVRSMPVEIRNKLEQLTSDEAADTRFPRCFPYGDRRRP